MIYIQSPLTDESRFVMENRYNINLQFTTKLIQKYIACFNPIVYGWGFYSKGLLANDPIIWFPVNYNFMIHATHSIVLQLKNWEKSLGVKTESDYFRRQEIPITYISEKTIMDIISGRDFELIYNENNQNMGA